MRSLSEQFLSFSRKFALLLFLLLSTTALSVQAQDISPFQGKKISAVKVNVEGIKKNIDTTPFLDAINIRPGERFSLAKIRESVKSLYTSGRASGVKTEAVVVGETVELVFQLALQLKVEEVTFSGNIVLSDTDLRSKLVGLDPGSRLLQTNIDSSAENLVEFYDEAGYFQVVVDSSIKPDLARGRAIVDFEIMPGEQAMVRRVEITGKTRLPVDTLVAGFKTVAEAPFSQTTLQNDMLMLRKKYSEAGYLALEIKSPEIKYISEQNSVDIKIEIDSGPLVEVEVDGFSVKKSRLREELSIFTKAGIDDLIIEESRLELLDIVQKEGYFFADISIKTESSQVEDNEKLLILFDVEKNQRYRLTDIQVIGTNFFDQQSIELILRSREATFFSRGITSQLLLRQDSERITNRLQELGFPKAKVVERRLAVSPNNENLIVTFVVEEGSRMLIKQIAFEGNSVFSDKDLSNAVPNKELSYFSQRRLNEDVDSLIKFYNEKGYAEASVSALLIRPDEESADITFRIREGEQIVINRIVISNRGTAQEGIIRKYLTFREGNILRREEMIISEQRLYATGAFRNISIRNELSGHNDQGQALHTIYIDTVEAPQYTLIYGFGLQSEDGPRGLLQIAKSNFLSRLQTATLTLRASRREQVAQLSYQFPRPFGLPVNPIAVAFYSRLRQVGFELSQFVGTLQVERQVDEKSELIFRSSLARINTTLFDGRSLDFQIVRLSGTYIRDTRDNIFDATKGTFTTADLASGISRNEADFLRFFLTHQRYLEVKTAPKLIFASNLQLGLARAYDSNKQRIPISERFFSGGSNTLRGFGFQLAGPRDADGRPTGGNALVVVSSEMRFPVVKKLAGVVFHDSGNVFRRLSKLNIKDFSNTVGAGLRLNTPLGPVRVDFGYLINPSISRERGYRVHFNFGQAF